MVGEADPVDVLMSIHPRHANGILSGEKTVEFRRKTPKRSVENLIVYCTSPVQRILGYARVVAVVEASLDSLWDQFGSTGGITREEFDVYFQGLDAGSALVLTGATAFDKSLNTSGIMRDSSPPQSFMYIPTSVVSSLAKPL